MDLKRKVHRKLLSLRCIDRIIDQRLFGDLYTQTTAEDQLLVQFFVDQGDRDGLLAWLDRVGKNNLEMMSLPELRKLGRQLGVRVGKKSKIQLIWEILDERCEVTQGITS